MLLEVTTELATKVTNKISDTETSTDAVENIKDTIEKTNQFFKSIDKLIPKLINFGINLLVALLIFAIGKIIINVVLKILNKFFTRTNMEISVKKFLHSLVKTIMYTILLIIICNQIGIQTTSFIAILGSAGLAAGLALQGSLSNFAGGVLILLLKPFKVGDYIIEDGKGKEGTVQKIDLFYTTLITPDNKMTVVPNGNLSNSSLTNLTAFDTRRIDLEVGISYESDIEKARELITNLAQKDEKILKDREILVYVGNLDSSQVTLGVRVWTKTEDYWTVKFRFLEVIKRELDENDVEIPFNQLVVHLDNK